jgi:hypothetical protein
LLRFQHGDEESRGESRTEAEFLPVDTGGEWRWRLHDSTTGAPTERWSLDATGAGGRLARRRRYRPSTYTFVYAKGYSYLTNDPGACANCHIMADHPPSRKVPLEVL